MRQGGSWDRSVPLGHLEPTACADLPPPRRHRRRSDPGVLELTGNASFSQHVPVRTSDLISGHDPTSTPSSDPTHDASDNRVRAVGLPTARTTTSVTTAETTATATRVTTTPASAMAATTTPVPARSTVARPGSGSLGSGGSGTDDGLNHDVGDDGGRLSGGDDSGNTGVLRMAGPMGTDPMTDLRAPTRTLRRPLSPGSRR